MAGIQDPLTLNYVRQARLFYSQIPETSKYHATVIENCTNADLLEHFSRLLATPALTLIAAAAFRPLLLDLCARWIHSESSDDHIYALALLIQPHEELFPVLYALLQKPAYQSGPLAFIANAQYLSPLSFDIPRLHKLLLSYYRLLQANRKLPQDLQWSLSPLSKLIFTPHMDNGVRLLAIQCYALQSGMSEAERLKLERQVLGESCGVDCPISYEWDVEGNKRDVDGWILPVLEVKRVFDARHALVQEPVDYYLTESGEILPPLLESDLSPLTVNVHGILLLKTPSEHNTVSTLISTNTTIGCLRNLAIQYSSRLPTLLTSPPSSGKSMLLSHLASLLYPGVPNQIITIHLADTSLDPRSLLGSHVSSTTQAGKFEWKEGVLVRAMREGKWVVFEDIDRGSSEVLGVLKPLVESLRRDKWIGGRASLQVPTRERVVAHNDFALFATRSLQPSRNNVFPAPVFFGAHKFHEIIVTSPTPTELQVIVDARFPRLAGSAAQAAIRLWEAIKSLGSAASTRDVGLRELEKMCSRLENLLPSYHQSMDIDDSDAGLISFSAIFPQPALREDMFLEARDVFFGAGATSASARAHTEAITALVGEHFALDPRQQESALSKTPEFTQVKDVNGRTNAVLVGRTRLVAKVAKETIRDSNDQQRPFAMHKPAVKLLSRMATAVSLSEPVLLTGETGTGKTSVITHLASLLRRPLVSLNLSHQTESSDLLGGFKPVDARIPAALLQERFLELFGATFSRRKNAKFEESVRKAVAEGKWKRAVGLWKESTRLAKDRIAIRQAEETAEGVEAPRKRRKIEQGDGDVSHVIWSAFERDVEEFEVQHVHGKGKFAFGFVEGPLVKALRAGDWVLLDEVNLASSETLECISGLLHGPTASITLTEQGSLEAVPRHPDFRLFACMNPATDVGKKDLPPNIRSRFTEIDVPPPDADQDTLLSIIDQYIGKHAVGDKAAIMNVAQFYSKVKEQAEKREIADGSNHKPHFSMRTLARALTFAADTAASFSLRRSIWEGCLMAFTMLLDSPSAEIVTALAQKHLLVGVRNPRSLLTKEPTIPSSRSADEFVKFGPFYLERGPLPVDLVEDYIMTPSVETKLIDLARIILTRRFPVLIEGPTSSGKTSSVEYLARRTGHHFIRINNHEHTDIQEYLGSYVSDPLTGKLVFKDGLLVRALRNGDWIVLDELNLAPTDVLEALNRLLDDNRELVIPETHEVVIPHPNFMLFATQNPPGLYAGRKVLSRAFRNRFLEVHFQDVPQSELETILCQRCKIAPSYGARIVQVFHELQKRRQSSRVFESKQGFATLRDLFRWAGRDAVGYQELAENGYMLLAERARREDDKKIVKEVIESVMKVKIDEQSLYDLHRADADFASFLGSPLPSSSQLVWTAAMQRLYILVGRALRFNEPVLLVGETGSGKTSVCQVYAEAVAKQLHGLNCHQNTETADLIGGLRPVRNRGLDEAEVLKEVAETLSTHLGQPVVESTAQSLLSALDTALGSQPGKSRLILEEARRKLIRLKAIFEWHDGPLVQAMQAGDVFLLDEISLADDSVLERLNSVLEPGRTIVLAERGGDDLEHPAIRAADDFKLVATMNPGGDYGKKELSPALRNRFTEIWVPAVDDRHDLELIVNSLWKFDVLKPYTVSVLDFVEWLCSRVSDRSMLSLRDILAWVSFSNAVYSSNDASTRSPNDIFHHAAHMTFLDGLGSFPQLASYSVEALRRLKSDALAKLEQLAPSSNTFSVEAHDAALFFQLGPFVIPRGSQPPLDHTFNLQAPTTQDNAIRVVRACQVAKPILLEGSPGVGKTSLITALANISGHELCRINLSDQTDLIDLFGSDLPVEGGGPGEFAWKDAEFLKALQEGNWVLLDEMNLAPQAVLEGLNAVLDHRGTVYIPELGRSFTRHPSFRIFAAQNPLSQGGGRKGLPKSFVNRFTKVYVDELSAHDLLLVCQHVFPTTSLDTLQKMIAFNTKLNEEIGLKRTFAREGGPWEFNLRDVLRWGGLMSSTTPPLHPAEFLQSVYLHRFRSLKDRAQARVLFEQVFNVSTTSLERAPYPALTVSDVQFGNLSIARKNMASLERPGRILHSQLAVLESVGHCVSQSWLSILTGAHDTGKTSIVRMLAAYTGNHLYEISINSATDTMDILGSFEQVDNRGRVVALVNEVLSLVSHYARSVVGSKIVHSASSEKLREVAIGLSTTGSLVSSLGLAVNVLNDLSAQVEQVEGMDLQPLHLRIDALLQEDTRGRFEWVDGPLLRAMKEGHWVLMDGANLCNPSVLDRLNSVCEPNGVLTLSERGYVNGEVQVVKPHPNFRLFMTVNPQHGELSRAMRNRGIEVSLLIQPSEEDRTTLADHLRLPSVLAAGVFDFLRRGTVRSSDNPSLETQWPLGQSLDHDSESSNVITQLSSFPSSQVETKWYPEAVLHFLAATVVPSSVPRLSRYMEAAPPSFIDARYITLLFPALQTASVLDHIRSHFSGCSSNFLLTQPTDFYLNPRLRNDGALQSGCTKDHRVLLQVLNLIVVLVAAQADAKKRSSNSKSKIKGPVHVDIQQQILTQVTALLEGIQATVYRVLEDVNILSEADIEFSARLMRYSKHLRQAAIQASVDYSAIQAISHWIASEMQDCPQLFFELSQKATDLKQTVSLSSGFGLSEIWSTLLINRPHNIPQSELLSLDSLANKLDHSTDVTGLRRRVYDLFALLTLPDLPKDDNLNMMAALMEKLQILLSKNLVEEELELSVISAKGPSSLIIELALLADFRFDLQGFEKHASALQRVIDSSCENSRESVIRLVPYQHLLWALNANKPALAIIAQTQIQWLTSIWNTPVGDGIPNGPTMLFHPTQIHSILSSLDWSHNSLSSLNKYERVIRRHVELGFIQCEWKNDRLQQLSAVFWQAVIMLSLCFPSSFEEQVLNQLRELSGPTKNVSELDVVSLLEGTSNIHLRSMIHDQLRPAVLRLVRSDTRSHAIVNLGLCWIVLCQIIMNLYVPNTPVDPAGIQNCSFELWKQQESILKVQIQLHTQREAHLTGNTSNAVLEYLHGQLEEVVAHIVDAPVLPNRQDTKRLHTFWSEVSQFNKHVIADEKVKTLLTLLQSDDQTAPPREEVMQQSIAGFCQRLQAVYTEYADISTPLLLALLYMRTGLRFVAHAASTAADIGSLARVRIVTALVAFPSVRSSAALQREQSTSGPTGIPAFRHLLLSLSALSLDGNLASNNDTYTLSIDTVYQQIIRLRLIDRAKEAELEQVQESLYRRKRLDYDDIGEAEMEEREFIAMFPSFENALEPKEEVRPEVIVSKYKPLVDPLYIQHLVDIHHSLLDSAPNDVSLLAISRAFNLSRKSTLEDLIKSNASTLPETIDSESVPLQFSLLHDHLEGLHGITNREGQLYNFYADTNVVEAKKASLVLENLRLRLKELILEWPDQMVLQNLLGRCKDALALDLHSPIAKILAALEQLLVQSDDWETYANKQNTLKSHQMALTAIIVDWRRLELSCWKSLLETQAQTFSQGASEWWFRLYDSTVRGPLDAFARDQSDGSDSLAEYLNSLIPLLDDFIRSSPLGQFEARMRLLQSFKTYLARLALSKPMSEKLVMERVCRVLHATERFFTLFAAQLSSLLSTERAPLEKEIRDFIKLATWKDINVHALKASAQRTHHRLYKTIRKFRDVLRQPIAQRLQPEFAGEAEAKASASVGKVEVPAVEPVFTEVVNSSSGHLANLGRTFKRFDNLVSGQIHSFIASHSSELVDNFAVDIILSARSLAALTVPSVITGEKREKQQKALLVRKRKAWSDLLKELKRGGFAVNVKPEVLKQQREVRWIKEQPLVPQNGTDSGELYFNKLYGSFPALRDSLADHHSDVSTRELNRGVMLLESGFSMALDARARLISALGSYQHLDRLSCRMKMVLSSPNIVHSGSYVMKHLARTKETLFKFVHALGDVNQALSIFATLQPTPLVNEFVVTSAQNLARSTKLLCDPLDAVIDAVQLTTLPLILKDEHSLVCQVVDHLTQASISLQQCSETEPRLSHIFEPVRKWLDDQQVSLMPIPAIDLQSVENESDAVIDLLLVVVQSMLTRCPEVIEEDLGSEKDHYIRDDYRSVRDFTSLLKTTSVLAHLETTLVSLTSLSSDGLRMSLERVLPFLDIYMGAVKAQIDSHAQWTRTLFKLVYILCSVMHSIAKQGFCKPPEEDESGQGDATDATGGVGLGEGSGADNVSKDIEDESQVEGLKGETEENNENEPPKNGDNDAIEMSEDFGGEMEDVPDASDDENNGSDDGSEGEPDEQLGDLDDTAVDEKLWGDEKGPDGKDEKDGTTKDDHSKEQTDESEVVAKEGKQEKSKQEADQKNTDQEEENREQPEDMDQEMQEPEEEQGDPADANGAPMDDHVPDANTLDLPDEINFDGEQKGEEDEDIDMPDDELEDLDEEPSRDREDENSKEIPPEGPLNDDIEADSLPQAQDESEPTPEDQDQSEDQAVAQPDISAGDGADNNTQNEPQNADLGESSTNGLTGSAQGAAGQDSSMNQDDDKGASELDNPVNSVPESDDAGAATSGTQSGRAPSQPENSSKSATNPMRSLGDALKEIKQRFDEILDVDSSEDIRQHAADTSEAAPTQVEHVRPDDDTDMQALGSAGEEQVAKLNELTIEDESDALGPMNIDQPTDVDELSATNQVHENSVKPPADLPARTLANEDVEGAVTRDQGSAAHVFSEEESGTRPKINDVDDSQDVEMELREWQAAGFPDELGEHIWQRYESLTHDLAYALCEQLRLILEPTLATRLKGDYRTGKRLNMKKIISYIASDYTKDKIWLRRTRPSQREYQVLIAIDDSRSMAESHSVHLAYETLALVSKALSRLEAGDIAIAKFGKTVDVLHGFDQGPFTDQAGANVVNAFKFNQEATNVLSLVDTSLRVLEAARERRSTGSASSADLWQLEIIISDGICQDHDRLRTVLRKAEEQRVMIVFVIIDSLHATPSAVGNNGERNTVDHSILSMTNARLNDRMELETERYLDSFPFQYYVVLRNVEALPEVLSSTLKQFFERISEE